MRFHDGDRLDQSNFEVMKTSDFDLRMTKAVMATCGRVYGRPMRFHDGGHLDQSHFEVMKTSDFDLTVTKTSEG